MKSARRQFLHLAAGVFALPAMSRTARAQTFPTRPIAMIVPFGAGGGTDVIARIVVEHMSRTLVQCHRPQLHFHERDARCLGAGRAGDGGTAGNAGRAAANQVFWLTITDAGRLALAG
jgi:hypothetical protein